MRLSLAAFALFALLQAAPQAAAQDSVLRSRLATSPVEVQVIDDVVGGCWTNVEEITDLVTRLVEEAGVAASPEDASRALRFVVHGRGARARSGHCFGALDMRLAKPIGAPRPGEPFGVVLLLDEMRIVAQDPRQLDQVFHEAAETAAGRFVNRLLAARQDRGAPAPETTDSAAVEPLGAEAR